MNKHRENCRQTVQNVLKLKSELGDLQLIGQGSPRKVACTIQGCSGKVFSLPSRTLSTDVYLGQFHPLSFSLFTRLKKSSVISQQFPWRRHPDTPQGYNMMEIELSLSEPACYDCEHWVCATRRDQQAVFKKQQNKTVKSSIMTDRYSEAQYLAFLCQSATVPEPVLIF